MAKPIDQLTSDILSVLNHSTSALRPSEIRDQLSPKYHYDQRIFDVIIVRRLKKMVDEKLVDKIRLKSNDTRYRLTEKGLKTAKPASMRNKAALTPQQIFETQIVKILRPSISRQNIHRKSDLKTVETIGEVSLRGDAKADVFFWFNPDRPQEARLTSERFLELERKLVPEIQRFATIIIDELKNANIDDKGVRYEWKGSELEPFQARKVIEQEKAGLDFDAMVAIQFDGASVVNETNWEDEMVKVAKYDDLAVKKFKRFHEAVSEPGLARQSWLAVKAMDYVEEAGAQVPKFLVKAMHVSGSEIGDVVDDPWKVLDDELKPVQQLCKELVSEAYTSIAFDHEKRSIEPLAEETVTAIKAEVSTVMGELVDEGVIEVRPVYLLKLSSEKAKLKRKKLINNFPSPDIIGDLLEEGFSKASGGS
jgi:DNA-binding PadR family transcriptional regulator